MMLPRVHTARLASTCVQHTPYQRPCWVQLLTARHAWTLLKTKVTSVLNVSLLAGARFYRWWDSSARMMAPSCKNDLAGHRLPRLVGESGGVRARLMHRSSSSQSNLFLSKKIASVSWSIVNFLQVIAQNLNIDKFKCYLKNFQKNSSQKHTR